MKWKTFKTIVEQISQVISNETDISISADEMGEHTVEFHTNDDEFPLWMIGEGVCDGKKYASLSAEKRFYEDK